MRKVTAFAPATIANFIVGFDALGATVETLDGGLFGDTVTIESSAEITFAATGRYADKLPVNPDENLVMHCLNYFHKKRIAKKQPVDNIRLCLEKRLPICSGLGSSAASIVATLAALNAWYNQPFSDQDLLLMAGEMEKLVSGSVHYDNVAPCLLGGFLLMLPNVPPQPLPWFDDLLLVLHYPGIAVATKAAREILPAHFSMTALIQYGQKFAGFVNALHRHNQQQAIALLDDTLIEPHRSVLVENFNAIKASALQAGALAFGLSGSGSSCFAISDSVRSAENIMAAMPDDAGSFTHIARIARQGVKIIRNE